MKRGIGFHRIVFPGDELEIKFLTMRFSILPTLFYDSVGRMEFRFTEQVVSSRNYIMICGRIAPMKERFDEREKLALYVF